MTIARRNLNVVSSVKSEKNKLRQCLLGLKRENEKPVMYIVMAMPALQNPEGEPLPSGVSLV